MLYGEARCLAAYAIRQLRGTTLSEYARRINRSVSTMSNLARNWERFQATEDRAREMTKELEQRLDAPLHETI